MYICMYVCMYVFDCLWQKKIVWQKNHMAKKIYAKMHGWNYVIGRAKQAPHWGVQSRFRAIYICILEKWFPLQGERAHSMKLFCMYNKRFEISKTK